MTEGGDGVYTGSILKGAKPAKSRAYVLLQRNLTITARTASGQIRLLPHCKIDSRFTLVIGHLTSAHSQLCYRDEMAGLKDRSNEGEMVRLVPMIEFFTMNMSDPQGASPWRATATRWETLMEVPPMSDFVPGCDASAWNGIGAPRGTPTEIIERLNREINRALPIEGSKYALRTSAVSRALITD